MTHDLFDDRVCTLGEGPMWHPLRQQLFWFDIMRKRLMTRDAGGPREWTFDRHVSAAGWIDEGALMIATETGLIRFDVESGASSPVAPLEADNAKTRSNDGRADPHGGFWIGTMGKMAEPEAGAIYRYFKGEIRRLFAPITIPNAICFTPDGTEARFADTARNTVWRQALDADGWPEGAPQVYLDHRDAGLNPDGAVIDRDGRFLCAEWGAARVACYDRAGALVETWAFGAVQTSCPALGGPDLSTLYVTSARQGLGSAAGPRDGQTFAVATTAKGQEEHRVIP